MGSNPVAVTSPSDFAPASSKEFLDIQATIECEFTLKTRTWHDKKHTVKCHRTDKYSQHSSIIWPAWLKWFECFVYELSGCGFESSCSHFTFRFSRLLRARSSLTFRQTIECEFTLKTRNMIKKHTVKMHHTDKYSQHSSIICWLNGLSVHELSGCGFRIQLQSLHLQKQGVSLTYNYRVWIHSETRTWHDKNIQTSKHDKEIPKERYISLEETQKVIDDLRLL